jgi:hypothetical protein
MIKKIKRETSCSHLITRRLLTFTTHSRNTCKIVQLTSIKRPHEYAADEQRNICMTCAAGEQRNICMKGGTDEKKNMYIK